jgi:ABC-type lipoprotein release transport system permease subunit
LKDAQELFDKKGRINCMLALECSCAWANLPKIRAELQKLLPETKVVEIAGKAVARAETRWKAGQHARALIEREKKVRKRLKTERENMAALLVPLVSLACAFWIATLALANVRERRGEIALLRALGTRTPTLLGVFLLRAFLAGLTGGVLGVLAAVAGFIVHNKLRVSEFLSCHLSIGHCFLAILAVSLLSILAAWLPAVSAAGVDPAEILREE